MRPMLLLLLLSLTAPSVSSAQTSDEAAARARLFQSCGGVESGTLPTGVAPGLYRGTLGTQAITLELSKPGTETADRYSYDRYGVGIALDRGRAADRTASYALVAAESVFQGDGSVVRGCLNLAADGAALGGQWFTPDGKKRLPVRLTRVDLATVPLALPRSPGLLKLRATNPFFFLALNRPWTKVPGGLKEPSSGVTYPRLAGGAPALNAALQDLQLDLAASGLDCLSGNGVNLENGTDFSGAGTLSWKSARLVSLHEDVDYFCGGAHPDNYTAGVTLDARSGKAVRLTGKPGSLWPALSAQKVQALYLAGYPKDGDIAECLDEISAPEISAEYDNYTFYLTPSGLALWPTYLPHVAGACAEVVTVPYARIRTLADPKSGYFTDVYPR
ncbi:hypothetical protein Q0M94_09000 [Deinococcus radiomollis]|uniref:hypothetical protein n=1 Tax=Deinococcus radiomollis TaxID=468916 RepID=UPI0038911AA3